MNYVLNGIFCDIIGFELEVANRSFLSSVSFKINCYSSIINSGGSLALGISSSISNDVNLVV